MTNLSNQEKQFVAQFARYERLRKYPPGYERESTMTKPKLKHIAAVTRAQHLLETGVNVSGNESLRKSIDADIAILCEVRSILYHCIENPTLPFAIELPSPDKPLLDPIETGPDMAI